MIEIILIVQQSITIFSDQNVKVVLFVILICRMGEVVLASLHEVRQKLVLLSFQSFSNSPHKDQLYLSKAKLQYQQQSKSNSTQAIKNLIQNLRPIPIYKKAIKIIAIQFFAWKNSFLLLQKKYSINKYINIDQFLLTVQPRIPFSVDKFEKWEESQLYQWIESIYLSTIKDSASHYQWPKSFIEEWISNKNNQITQNLKKFQEIKARKRQETSTHPDRRCCVCYEYERDCIFIPCGHIVTCLKCAKIAKIKKCPLCRNNAKSYKIYY